MTEGCGLAPSISSEWRAAYASRNWACAATGRIADSSSEAAREECSLDSRVVSLRAWHWRETADCSRSEWARPASNVPFAKRRTSSAWASPETADGFWRQFEDPLPHVDFHFGLLQRPIGFGGDVPVPRSLRRGAGSRAAARAARDAIAASVRCEGAAGRVGKGLPNPFSAAHCLQVVRC
jgi:hypothetical protein